MSNLNPHYEKMAQIADSYISSAEALNSVAVNIGMHDEISRLLVLLEGAAYKLKLACENRLKKP